MSGIPQVSVIIPCYNQGKFLSEALDSVLSQTCDSWECLIIDDGSNDNTAEVAARYAERDGRICYLHQLNRGLSAARNRGLRESNGRYVQFLDADDVLLPEKIARQLEILQGTRHPALAYCDFYATDGVDLNSLVTTFLCEPRLVLENALLDLASRWETELSIPVHCFLIPSRFFREGCFEFDERLPSHEDWDLWIRLFRLEPMIAHVPGKLVVYRRHKDALCMNRDIMWQGFSQAIDKQVRLFNGNRRMQKVLRRKKAEMKPYYFGKSESSTAIIAVRARRFFKQNVPWPLQKLVARFIDVG